MIPSVSGNRRASHPSSRGKQRSCLAHRWGRGHRLRRTVLAREDEPRFFSEFTGDGVLREFVVAVTLAAQGAGARIADARDIVAEVQEYSPWQLVIRAAVPLGSCKPTESPRSDRAPRNGGLVGRPSWRIVQPAVRQRSASRVLRTSTITAPSPAIVRSCAGSASQDSGHSLPVRPVRAPPRPSGIHGPSASVRGPATDPWATQHLSAC